MERNPWLKALIVLLALIAGWYLVAQLWALATRFSDILLLFFLAWLLAFALNPLARLIQRRLRLPRIASVAAVYVGLVLLILTSIVLIIPIITLQLGQLGAVASSYSGPVAEWIASVQIELLGRGIDIDLDGFYRQQDLSTSIERIATVLVQNALGIVTGIASAMFGMVLVLVLSFYIMVDGGRLVRQILRAVPNRSREQLEFLLDSIQNTFGGFIRGQFIQCAIYGIGTALVMFGAGLDYVLLSSLFAGAMMLIPFLGPALAVVPPLLIAALQGSLGKVIVVGIALLLLQQIVMNVIAPKLMGHAVGLPPLLVILAMLLGAKLAGVLGAIFGVPFAAVVYAMLLFSYRRSSLNEATDAPAVDPVRRADVANRDMAGKGWLTRQASRAGTRHIRRREAR